MPRIKSCASKVYPIKASSINGYLLILSALASILKTLLKKKLSFAISERNKCLKHSYTAVFHGGGAIIG